MIKILKDKPIKKQENPLKQISKEEFLKTLPIKFQKNIKIVVDYLHSVGVTDIYLFGSLYEGDYNDNSDIDIAVYDLDPTMYYKVSATINYSFRIECDIIDLNDDCSITRFLKKYEEWIKIG